MIESILRASSCASGCALVFCGLLLGCGSAPTPSPASAASVPGGDEVDGGALPDEALDPQSAEAACEAWIRELIEKDDYSQDDLDARVVTAFDISDDPWLLVPYANYSRDETETTSSVAIDSLTLGEGKRIRCMARLTLESKASYGPTWGGTYLLTLNLDLAPQAATPRLTAIPESAYHRGENLETKEAVVLETCAPLDDSDGHTICRVRYLGTDHEGDYESGGIATFDPDGQISGFIIRSLAFVTELGSPTIKVAVTPIDLGLTTPTWRIDIYYEGTSPAVLSIAGHFEDDGCIAHRRDLLVSFVTLEEGRIRPIFDSELSGSLRVEPSGCDEDYDVVGRLELLERGEATLAIREHMTGVETPSGERTRVFSYRAAEGIYVEETLDEAESGADSESDGEGDDAADSGSPSNDAK